MIRDAIIFLVVVGVIVTISIVVAMKSRQNASVVAKQAELVEQVTPEEKENLPETKEAIPEGEKDTTKEPEEVASKEEKKEPEKAKTRGLADFFPGNGELPENVGYKIVEDRYSIRLPNKPTSTSSHKTKSGNAKEYAWTITKKSGKYGNLKYSMLTFDLHPNGRTQDVTSYQRGEHSSALRSAKSRGETVVINSSFYHMGYKTYLLSSRTKEGETKYSMWINANKRLYELKTSGPSSDMLAPEGRIMFLSLKVFD